MKKTLASIVSPIVVTSALIGCYEISVPTENSMNKDKVYIKEGSPSYKEENVPYSKSVKNEIPDDFVGREDVRYFFDCKFVPGKISDLDVVEIYLIPDEDLENKFKSLDNLEDITHTLEETKKCIKSFRMIGFSYDAETNKLTMSSTLDRFEDFKRVSIFRQTIIDGKVTDDEIEFVKKYAPELYAEEKEIFDFFNRDLNLWGKESVHYDETILGNFIKVMESIFGEPSKQKFDGKPKLPFGYEKDKIPLEVDENVPLPAPKKKSE